jgi:hypothetical protein
MTNKRPIPRCLPIYPFRESPHPVVVCYCTFNCLLSVSVHLNCFCFCASLNVLCNSKCFCSPLSVTMRFCVFRVLLHKFHRRWRLTSSSRELYSITSRVDCRRCEVKRTTNPPPKKNKTFLSTLFWGRILRTVARALSHSHPPRAPSSQCPVAVHLCAFKLVFFCFWVSLGAFACSCNSQCVSVCLNPCFCTGSPEAE